MKPKQYKQMMSWLTRNKSTKMSDHLVDTLNKYEDAPNIQQQVIKYSPKKVEPDILRNMLIEEMKTRDLDSDEIKYLMDTKDRKELPKATPKQTAFIKKKIAPINNINIIIYIPTCLVYLLGLNFTAYCFSSV